MTQTPLVQQFIGSDAFYAAQAQLLAAARATESTAIRYLDLEDGRIELKVQPTGIYECNEVPKQGPNSPPTVLVDETAPAAPKRLTIWQRLSHRQ